MRGGVCWSFLRLASKPAGRLGRVLIKSPLADKPLSTGRLSEYPTDYYVGICIETSAVAEQNTLWLPRVDFSYCCLRLTPLEK
jgi:hypothetical protein